MKIFCSLAAGRSLLLQRPHGASRRAARSVDARRCAAQYGRLFRGFHSRISRVGLLHRLHGRSCDRPLFDEDPAAYVYTGQGLNIQTSYLFDRKWEIALRNSTLFRQRRFSPWQNTAPATRRRWASPVISSATV